MKFGLTGLLLVLPFFTFPWLTDPNAAAKAYFFYFVVLLLLCKKLAHENKLYVDSTTFWWGSYVFALSISAVINNNQASSWQFVSMVTISCGFFYLMKSWCRHHADVMTLLMKVHLFITVLFSLLGLGQGLDFVVNGGSVMLVPYLLPGTWGLRISGPFGQPNFHALLMVSGLCSFAYVYLKEVWGKRSPWIQVGSLLLPLLLWLNFFQTDSRGGKVALVAVMLSFFWLKRRYPELMPTRLGWQPFALLTGLGFAAYILRRLLMILLFEPSIVQVLQTAQSYSITSRINMWFSSLLIALDYPIFGVGPDNFKKFLLQYQVVAQDILHFEYEDLGYTRWAHNEFLQVLAEGGLVSFVLFSVLVSVILINVFRSLKSQKDSFSIFAVLSIVPFCIQALFSWPLRFTPLLAIFIAILSSLLPNERYLEINLGKYGRGLLTFACIVLLLLGTWSFVTDLRVRSLQRKIVHSDMVTDLFPEYSALVDNAFAENELLIRGTTPFVQYILLEEDKSFASRMIPYLERGIHLEGSYWQWYNFARVLFVAGEEDRSMAAILKSIELNPLHGPGWAFRHHLDVVAAVRKTGRPIESFKSKGIPELDLDHGRNIIPQYQ